MAARQHAARPAARAPAGAAAPQRQAAQAPADARTRCACGGGCPRCAGQALPRALQADWAPAFGRPLDRLRVHAGPDAARRAQSLGAVAYTEGADIGFASGRYRPGDAEGRALLAHEVAHALQQDPARPGPRRAPDARHEAQADAAAAAVLAGRRAPALHAATPGVQRRVEMRGVGRGEFSGLERLPELMERLNALCPGLVLTLDADSALVAEQVDGATLTVFEQQLLEFIQDARVIPLRLTNRHGLLGTHATGFNTRVTADSFSFGYVDIDDLLASSDSGLQAVIVHFFTERMVTRNYDRRMRAGQLTGGAGVEAEFDAAHRAGIDAEVRFLRGFLDDPSVRFVNEPANGPFIRVYRNGRGDLLRMRLRSRRGVDAVSMDVFMKTEQRTVTLEEYRDLLQEEREREATRAQVERERLGGAAEHHAGGHAVPAP